MNTHIDRFLAMGLALMVFLYGISLATNLNGKIERQLSARKNVKDYSSYEFSKRELSHEYQGGNIGKKHILAYLFKSKAEELASAKSVMVDENWISIMKEDENLKVYLEDGSVASAEDLYNALKHERYESLSLDFGDKRLLISLTVD